MGHLWLNPEDKQFWKFCFDDISKNDVPAFLDYIVRFTGFSKCELPNAVFNLKTSYFCRKSACHWSFAGHFGHFCPSFSESGVRPHNWDIYCHIAHHSHQKCPDALQKSNLHASVTIQVSSRLCDFTFLTFCCLPLIITFRRNGGPVFTRKSRVSGNRIGLACELPISRQMCVLVYSFMIGPNFSQLDKKRIGVYTGHMPTTTAAQNLIHFHQVFKTNRFQKFDHGSEEKNLIKYGSPEPPEYDLKRITHPNMYLIYGLNDFYMSQDGVESLKTDLKHAREFYELSDPKANHMDPLIGLTTAVEVNRKVIGILKRYP